MPLWTPDVWGSGSKPAGTRSTQEGAYWFTEIIGDPNNVLCGGWGLVRLTGTVDRDGPNANRVKTHCPAGHAYDEANTYRYRGGRYCRACKRLRNRG